MGLLQREGRKEEINGSDLEWGGGGGGGGKGPRQNELIGLGEF